MTDTILQLEQYQAILTDHNDPVAYTTRLLLWGLVWFLEQLVTSAESTVNTLLNNLFFFDSAPMQALTSSLNPLIWALLFVGIVLLGIQLLFNRSEKKSQIPLNLIAFIMIVTALPTFMSTMGNMTQTAVNTFSFTDEESGISIATSIISGGVEDLAYYDEQNFSQAALDNKNQISVDKTQHLNPLELMDPNDTINKELFQYELVVGSDGEYTTKKLENGLFGWELFSQYYYRFKIDWFVIIGSLLAIVIALGFSGLKVAKIIFELGYSSIFILFVAPLDLSTGQRMKKAFSEILNLFLVLICVSLIFRVFVYGVSWIASTLEGFPLVVALLGFAWAMIDGPNIIQKILGIDGGIASGGTFLSQLYSGGRMITDSAKAIGALGSKAIDTGKKVKANAGKKKVGSTAGADHGILNGGNQTTPDNATNEYGFSRDNLFDQSSNTNVDNSTMNQTVNGQEQKNGAEQPSNASVDSQAGQEQQGKDRQAVGAEQTTTGQQDFAQWYAEQGSNDRPSGGSSSAVEGVHAQSYGEQGVHSNPTPSKDSTVPAQTASIHQTTPATPVNHHHPDKATPTLHAQSNEGRSTPPPTPSTARPSMIHQTYSTERKGGLDSGRVERQPNTTPPPKNDPPLQPKKGRFQK